MKGLLPYILIMLCSPVYTIVRAAYDLNGPQKGPQAYDLVYATLPILIGFILGLVLGTR